MDSCTPPFHCGYCRNFQPPELFYPVTNCPHLGGPIHTRACGCVRNNAHGFRGVFAWGHSAEAAQEGTTQDATRATQGPGAYNAPRWRQDPRHGGRRPLAHHVHGQGRGAHAGAWAWWLQGGGAIVSPSACASHRESYIRGP